MPKNVSSNSAGEGKGEGVILLHGLCRSARSMDVLAAKLRHAGYVVLNQGYPSRQAPITELAEKWVSKALSDDCFTGCERLHFVTHSMGGILVRMYLSKHDEPRLGRVVMLGPPNQGSEVVDRLGSWWLFKWLNGPAGGELGTTIDSTPNTLGPVSFDLGVIAGRRSINWINSCFIYGPDDGKVSVARTRVSGMKDHLVMPVSHPFLMRNSKVIHQVLHYLSHGVFSRTEVLSPRRRTVVTRE